MSAIRKPRASHRWGVAVLGLVALGALANTARAGMCGTPMVRVYPWKLTSVPANLQLRVRVHRDVRDEAVPKTVPMSFVALPEHGDAVALRPTPVATHAGTPFTWLTLAPERPLVVGEKYTLQVDARPFSSEPFVVGPVLKATAPTFTVRSARYVMTRPQGNSKGSVYGDHVVVQLGATSVPESQLVFLVTPLDLSPAPPIWRDVDGGTFSFGAIGECGYRDLALARTGRQRFELRAVDLAGQVSEPVTITVDTGAPERAPR